MTVTPSGLDVHAVHATPDANQNLVHAGADADAAEPE